MTTEIILDRIERLLEKQDARLKLAKSQIQEMRLYWKFFGIVIVIILTAIAAKIF